MHERELKRLAVKMQLPSGKAVSVIPDAYLQLHEAEAVGPGYWHDLVWELDMGTTEQRDFRQKVAALIAYAIGPYREVMGLGQQAFGEWFCIRGTEPTSVSPEELYLSPSWRQPFQPEPIPLISLGEPPL